MLQRLCASALVGLAAAPVGHAQEGYAPGFHQSGALPVPGAGGSYATLSDGRVFLFDGQLFELYDASGVLLASLGSLAASTFPSFAILDPTETFAVVGESSFGDLYTVDLAGAGFSPLANLAFNFDAAFDPLDAGVVFVSAAVTAFGTNDLYRLELATGSATALALVDGPSGPLVLDAAGDLYYATQDIDFPADPGSTDVLRWTRAQLESGVLLDERDATVFAAGLDGGTALAFGPRSGHLFVAENVFASGVSRVLDLGPDGAQGAEAVRGTRFLGNLEFFADPGTATFQAFQPDGVTLRVHATDFVAFASEILSVAPRRPSATLSGPTTGPAVKTLTIHDAHPESAVVLFFGSIDDLVPEELTLELGLGFPFHTSLAIADLRRMPFPLPTDADGTATFSYYDPGHLHGQLVLQTAVLGAGGRLAGTSTAATN